MSSQVCPNHIQLKINGEIVGEQPLASLLNKESNSSNLRKIVLANIGGDGNSLQGYVRNFEVFPFVSPIKDQHLKVIP